MAREINRLTARQVQTLTRPGRHADGDGLYLVVDASGAKRWTFLAMLHGRRREFGLGPVRHVTLQQAREKAQDARQAILRGEDPRKPQGPSPVFSEASTVIISEMAPGWRGRDTEAHWKRSLLDYAEPLSKLPVDQIVTEDVVRVLKPFWRSRPESGRKLRQRIETVLDASKVKGWRSGENPARFKGHLDKLLPKQSRVVNHRRAVPYEQMPEVMKKLAAHTTGSARAMEWTIYTVARETMTTEARWKEVTGEVWSLGPDRMKMETGHEVPLSVQALDVLEAVKISNTGPDALIFPGAKKGRPMSDQTMDKLLDTLGINASPHGFRSTFRDWAGDQTDYAEEVMETALAHVVGSGTRRAYRRRKAMEKLTALLQEWADYIRPRPEESAAPAPPEE